MLEFTFRASPRELHDARHAVGEALHRHGAGAAHADDAVAVMNELIAAARECGVMSPVQLTVAMYPLLTSLRLRCDHDVELRDKPFEVRERIIEHLALAFGRRRRGDGTVDLWAEIARRA